MSIDYTPTTELEAVNAILAASNEAPVTSLTNRPDVVMAQNALAAALREIMSVRWRFNSDINYPLAGTAFGGGFVFPEPAGLLAFTLTPTEAQRGLDIVSRPSRTYQVGGLSVRILANRIGGSDVMVPATLRINPVWAVPFALAPEAARKYIVASAIRRRAAQNGFKDQLESAAADEQAAAAALQAIESPAANPVSSDGFSTETDALNTLLAMAKQQPVVDALAAEGTQITALNELRQAVVDVCAMGWRFNTEVSYGLEPEAAVYNWTDVDETITPVLIYLAPSNLLSATPTDCQAQSGDQSIDPIVQKSQRYTDVGGGSPKVLYDRAHHRDGFPADERTVLWLDVTWRKPFDNMPEEARRYATILAGRRYCASFGASPRWTEQDELAALHTLRMAEGKRDVRNIFRENPGVLAKRGGRRSSRDPFIV